MRLSAHAYHVRRALIVLIMLAFAIPAATAHAATNYYVSPTGSNSNPGTFNQPFQTIQQCANVAVAGDTCFIRAGIYRETVTPANSGTSSASITFQPYNGESVTVSGANIVGNWSLYSANVYQASVTLPTSGYNDTGFFANQVFVDGQMMIEARWPNTGLDLLNQTLAVAGSGTTSSATSTTVYDSSLPNISGGWTGGTAYMIGGYGWVAQTGQITSSSSGQFTYSTSLASWVCPAACAKQNNQYYLTGKLAALDSPTEWFYDGAVGKLYLWTQNGDTPANHTVEVKQRINAFNLAGRDSIQIKNLSLFAATVTTDANSDYNTIDGINARYISHYVTIPYGDSICSIYCARGSDTGIILNGNSNTIKNSTLAYSAGNGIALLGSSNTAANNLIHDMNYAGVYNAPIELGGSNETITNNTIYNAGRDGINGGAGGNTIAYNHVYNYGILNHDVGGYYTCCSQDGTNSSLHHNWFHDNRARTDGGIGAYTGAGIYIDNNSNHFLAHHNVVWNTVGRGIFFHGNGGASQYNLAYNNTIGTGQNYGVSVGNTNDGTGSKLVNNIALNGVEAGTNVVSANNLPTSSNPQFLDSTSNNYRLSSSSPAINYGQVITGITDGYAGSAPDTGAYEYGAADWGAPGCNFANCMPSSINMADNSGFESSSASRWTWTSGTFAIVANNAHTGLFAAKATGTSSGVGQVVYGLSPNTTYTLRAWAKVGSGESALIGAKRYAGESSYTNADVTSTSYQQLTVSFTTGASNTSAEIYLWKSTGSGDAYADDFLLEVGPPNLLNNPGFDDGSSNGWTWTYGGLSIVNSDMYSGGYAAKVAGASSGVGQVVSGLSPNTTYRLRGWAKVASTGEQISIGVKQYNTAGDYTYQLIGTTTYSQVTLTFTTGPSNTTAEIYIWKDTGSGMGWGDALVLTRV